MRARRFGAGGDAACKPSRLAAVSAHVGSSRAGCKFRVPALDFTGANGSMAGFPALLALLLAAGEVPVARRGLGFGDVFMAARVELALAITTAGGTSTGGTNQSFARFFARSDARFSCSKSSQRSSPSVTRCNTNCSFRTPAVISGHRETSAFHTGRISSTPSALTNIDAACISNGYSNGFVAPQYAHVQLALNRPAKIEIVFIGMQQMMRYPVALAAINGTASVLVERNKRKLCELRVFIQTKAEKQTNPLLDSEHSARLAKNQPCQGPNVAQATG